MATALSNLSSYDPTAVPDGKGKRVGIVVSDWNSSVTHSLLNGATNTLLKFGVSADDIIIEHVPGSFELTYAAKVMIEKAKVDSIIILGCVIQGETPHFTFVCHSVTEGTTQLNLKYDVPVIFGLLTTLTLDQAQARAGGRHGNKGDEAAITALKMMELQTRYK
ncbi:6,7-dimethyl-8-ribityllumazine synthase [Proteiniphilum acetatigenes]|uniref:6,7-dimethyl-8-ribityllumazine synthase n=1 Tax=Proteiniphilum acetatigenes TaxID=294710 RepID=UPI000368339B|nr:6,7-dimethyl-8-ribityllumazine synthase [Proteiniphilum acetatigenes]SFK35744.1 6,7-dimethyl-8-ribityllumazine synthase [Porphyromonadaceae bacterium KH3CP3RA]